MGLTEVDDRNALAVIENKRLGTWVPALGLVPEVNACVEQVFGCNAEAHSDLMDVEKHRSTGGPPCDRRLMVVVTDVNGLTDRAVQKTERGVGWQARIQQFSILQCAPPANPADGPFIPSTASECPRQLPAAPPRLVSLFIRIPRTTTAPRLRPLVKRAHLAQAAPTTRAAGSPAPDPTTDRTVDDRPRMAAPSARVSPCTASSFPNRRLSPVVSMLFTEKIPPRSALAHLSRIT